MKSYLIALGSNVGDRAATLSSAVAMLRDEVGPVLAVSSFYATAPIGAATEPFINAALVLESTMEPLQVMRALLAVERRHGRTREIAGGNRTLDCDLILCRVSAGDMLVMADPELTMPHPRALERDFVLVPAAEVAPTWRHPATGETLRDECIARRFHLNPLECS